MEAQGCSTIPLPFQTPHTPRTHRDSSGPEAPTSAPRAPSHIPSLPKISFPMAGAAFPAHPLCDSSRIPMPWPCPTFPGHHCGTDLSRSPACGGFSLSTAVGMALHCDLNADVLQFVQGRGSWHSCPAQGSGLRLSWAFPAQTKGGICPVLPAGSAHKPLPSSGLVPHPHLGVGEGEGWKERKGCPGKVED